MQLVYPVILLCTGAITCLDPLVLTKNGLVRGYKAENGQYSIFLGIPYAKVNPNNPFGEAIDVPRFEGIYDATDDSAICPQQDELDLTIVGILDCLRVHVYVPETATSRNKLPVMVWIHGGGFRQWDSRQSTYGPRFLVRNGVILVTFNYRLGPYGFMALKRLVRHFYIGHKDIGAATVNEMIEFDSDFTYVYPILRSSRYHLQASSAPVFLYMFDYAGERNYMKYRLNMTSEPGAMHGDELGYLFYQSYYTLLTNTTDNMIIYRMTAMWTDFAKISNPTPKPSELVPFAWRASTLEPSFSYAWLDHRVQMVQHPYYQRMAFWDAFFTIYGDKTRW